MSGPRHARKAPRPAVWQRPVLPSPPVAVLALLLTLWSSADARVLALAPAGAGWVAADGRLVACPGWRLTLGPGLQAGLSGPVAARPAPPWQAVAVSGRRRCLVRTEAADAVAVYVRVRVEPERGAASTALVRWDVASGTWADRSQ